MLELQRLLLKERVGHAQSAASYDILDPECQTRVGVARELPGILGRLLRSLVPQARLPTTITVSETEDESLIFTVRGRVRLSRQSLEVYDADDHFMGSLQRSFLSRPNGYSLYDFRNERLAEVRGRWAEGEFRFVAPDGRELAIMTKRWAGPGKDLLMSTGDFVVALHGDLVDQPLAKMLLVAAALALAVLFNKHPSSCLAEQPSC
jgi:hypothetical protein